MLIRLFASSLSNNIVQWLPFEEPKQIINHNYYVVELVTLLWHKGSSTGHQLLASLNINAISSAISSSSNPCVIIIFSASFFLIVNFIYLAFWLNRHCLCAFTSQIGSWDFFLSVEIKSHKITQVALKSIFLSSPCWIFRELLGSWRK